MKNVFYVNLYEYCQLDSVKLYQLKIRIPPPLKMLFCCCCNYTHFVVQSLTSCNYSCVLRMTNLISLNKQC